MQLYDWIVLPVRVQAIRPRNGVGQVKLRQSCAVEPSRLQQLYVREGLTHLIRQVPRFLYGAGGRCMELQLQRLELLS